MAHQYGWTIEQIGRLTPRQIDGIITAIRKRQHFELATDASLHGMKLKNEWRDDDTTIELTQKEQDNLDRALQEAMQRKIKTNK